MSKKSIVVKRVGRNVPINTTEVEDLASATGYDCCEIITQNREEDVEYNIGEGKVPDIYTKASEHGVDAIIFDNILGPYQIYNLGIYVDKEIEILDRYELILQLFEKRANTKQAQQQVELARLRRELTRSEVKSKLASRKEKPGFMGLGEYDKSKVKDIKNRIKRIQDDLQSKTKSEQDRRERRRENGFDLISLAGYTNAGKSTLLRRLSEDHTVRENKQLHPDIKPTAESSDDYFTTLDTTTRRMNFDKRKVLLTDTVGFIRNLPHWLINAFNATFESTYNSDLVLLVVDITDDIPDIRKKINTCHDNLKHRNVTRTLTVFNKCDNLTDYEIDHKLNALQDIAPDPVAISAKNGDGIHELKQAIHKSLPPFRSDKILIPWTENTMKIVSWVHENGHVVDSEYTSNGVFVNFEGRKQVIQKAKNKLSNV